MKDQFRTVTKDGFRHYSGTYKWRSAYLSQSSPMEFWWRSLWYVFIYLDLERNFYYEFGGQFANALNLEPMNRGCILQKHCSTVFLW